MRKFRLSMVLVITVGAFSVGASFGAPAEANGCSLWNNATNRYEVDDETDLNTLRSSLNCLNQTLVQTDDIDLAVLDGSDWSPISDFAGSYNGGGKSITGLKLSGSDAGLFNTTTSATTIENLTVVVDPSSVAENRVGPIIGHALGPVTIENVSVTASFTANQFVGGLIGLARENVTISGTTVSGEIHAAFSVGGMIGRSEMGDLNTISFSDSRAMADITISGSFAGGLFGVGLDSDLVIENTSVEANITSGTSNGGYAAGFAGGARSVTVTDSSASGEVEAGIVGVAGGFVASLMEDSEVRRSYWNGSVLADRFQSGGFFGFGVNVTIEDSYCLGEITSEDGTAAGFIADVFGDLTVVRSFSRCTSSAPVSGGFFSEASGNVSISDSFATGSNSGVLFGGGFGWRTNGDLTVTTSYVSSTLTDSAQRSKFVIETIGSELVTNAFCIDGDCPAEYLVTEEELKSSDFLVGQSWDLTNVWCIKSSLNDGFPVLREIDFGPGGTNNCRSNRRPSKRTVTLDPAGGVCGDHSSPWDASFRGSYTLPSSTDCLRDGFVLLGWAIDPSNTAPENLLTEVVSRSGTLTAVWGPLAPAPTSVNVLHNFFCEVNCTSAVVFWPVSTTSSDAAVIMIDAAPTACDTSGDAFGQRWCWITGLTPRTTHTVTVAWRNQYGTGPSATAVFTLN